MLAVLSSGVLALLLIPGTLHGEGYGIALLRLGRNGLSSCRRWTKVTLSAFGVLPRSTLRIDPSAYPAGGPL
jgi:hypothetical protein